jgi:serine/threonine protein kinase
MIAGEKCGPYEIVEPIGKGGMGEVYRARDTRVGRDVAIKVTAEQFSERFQREAQTIASLNHPNICTLYDVGPDYLVMELVEGESPQGPLPLENASACIRGYPRRPAFSVGSQIERDWQRPTGDGGHQLAGAAEEVDE